MKHEETYAVLIKGEMVEGTIVVNPDDKDFWKYLESQYDKVELVGDKDRPSRGWKWDGRKWLPGLPPDIEAAITDRLDLDAQKVELDKKVEEVLGESGAEPSETDNTDTPDEDASRNQAVEKKNE